MTTLTGKLPKDTYKDILQVSNSNSGIDGTLRDLEDGEGTVGPFKISTDEFAMNSGTLFSSVGIDDNATSTQLTITDTVSTFNGDVTANGAWVLPETLLTIASGEVTVTGSSHSIAAEGGAANDDLDTINGGVVGQIIIFRQHFSAQDITFKDGTGNMNLAGDFAMTTGLDTLMLKLVGSTWIELSRSKNA